MPIKFVLGTSGSGKTEYARNKAVELAMSGQRTALLVPEQFSFETERAMLDLIEPKLADRVEVFSFTRLANKIAKEVGGLAGKRLDKSGRAAVMSVAMSQIRDNLELYAAKKKGQDFISEMLNAVNEFKSCAISPKMLSDAALQTEDKLLRQKLKELSLIYNAYNAYVESSGAIDPLDDLSRLAKNLEDVNYFSGMTVISDSFTGFTGQEMKVLKQIIAGCDEFIITLCCDRIEKKSGSELFDPIRHTAERLSAFDSNVSFEYLSGNGRFKNDALISLEKSVFRLGNQNSFTDKTEAVTVYSAADKYDETEFIAREIRKLAREKNMRWRDFAIICRTASDYQGEVLRSLDQQGISYFCDKRSAVTESPIVRFILAAFDIVLGGWKSEDVFRWMKTGMIADLNMIDIARLENYCYIWSIKGEKWQREFVLSPNGYSSEKSENEDEILARINSTREKAVGLLNKFAEVTSKRNVKGIDFAAAVFTLLDDAGTAGCIERMIPKLSKENAAEQGQIWNSIMNILDQMAVILSETVLTAQEFADILNLMISFCDVGKIPQSMDQVVFGDADRIRTSDPRVVFVLGANDGVFPLSPKEGGIFTQNERNELISIDLPLNGDSDESAAMEEYLAYSAITCSSESVYITYANSCNGESLYSSEIVAEVVRAVPNCRRMSISSEVSLEMLEAVDAGFLLAAKSIHDDTEFSNSLAEVYRQRAEYSDKLRVIENASHNEPAAITDKSLAYRLFGKNIKISASKAECFYNCKFMYFCKYGMRAMPRRRAELDPLEYGSVVHYVLEQLLKEYDISILAEDEHLTEKIRSCLERYLSEVMGGVDMKSARFLYLFRRLSETLTVLIIQLSEDLAKSLFRPEALELPVDGNDLKPLKIGLSDGTEIVVGGKIDRVDVYKNNGRKYVRVVDYKTGSKEFLLSDILSGLNMQMLIYLDILCGANAVQSPAGIVYSPASIGKFNGVRGEDSFEQKRRDALKKNGLIIDVEDVINAMEFGMEKKIDKKENVGIKGSDTFSSSSTYVADEKQFEKIRHYVRLLLKEMGEALHHGDITALPAKGLYDSCAYCDYHTLCSTEIKTNGKDIEKKGMADTIEIIERECEQNG